MDTATVAQDPLVRLTELDIDKITIDSNVRSEMNQLALKELADNIKIAGIIQPLIVREGASGLYHLIAGHRRLAAAKQLDMKTVPVRVLNIDAEDSAMIQTFENLHREDLNPIDEAKAFKGILDSGKLDFKGLAKDISKSETYVYRSVRLLELPAKVQNAIADGHWSAGHGHQLLRVPANLREAVLKRVGNRDITAADLADAIEREIGTSLEYARFPIDKPFMGVATPEKAADVACSACPFNSGNQGMLFAGAEKGKCTFKPCFDAKTDNAIKQVHRANVAKNPTLKDMGVKKVGYNGDVEGVKNGTLVQAMTPEIKKAMKEHPEKFAVVTKAPDHWERGPIKGGILCLDKKILPKAKSSFDPSTGRPRLTSKERFMLAYVNAALWKAAAKITLGKAQLVAVARHCGASYLITKKVSDALGFDVTSKSELEKLTAEQLGGVVLALVCSGYNEPNTSTMNEAGVMVNVIKQKATADGKAAFEAKGKKNAKGPGKAVGGDAVGTKARGKTAGDARKGKGGRSRVQPTGAGMPDAEDRGPEADNAEEN